MAVPLPVNAGATQQFSDAAAQVVALSHVSLHFQGDWSMPAAWFKPTPPLPPVSASTWSGYDSSMSEE
eukprot:893781-Rhodomonas_salina.1